MRTIKFLALCCGIILFVCSCSTCKIDKPKNLKAIDWENYNDVYTVFWNGKKDCSEVSGIGVWTCEDNHNLKDIKVYGWIFQGAFGNPVNPAEFTLISNEEDIFWYNYSTRGGNGIGVSICRYTAESNEELVDALRNKFATADITKKCYVKGKFSYQGLPTNDCCSTIPVIIIFSADDIYFEEE